MAIEAKLDRPKSLTDLAVAEIRGAIVDGRLAFGEQLSEAVLAIKLGISRRALSAMVKRSSASSHMRSSTRPTEPKAACLAR